MIHVALFLYPAIGHSNAILQIAKDLQELHPTTFTIYCSELAMDQVQKRCTPAVENATWVPIRDGNRLFGEVLDRELGFGGQGITIIKAMVEPVLGLITPEFRWKFDFVIHDHCVPRVATSCKALGIPCYTFLSIQLVQCRNWMRRNTGSASAREFHSATAILVHSIRMLEGHIVSDPVFRDIDVRFILPAVLRPHRDERLTAWLDTHPARSILYVSMGTVSRLRPRQVASFAEALERCGMPYIWSLSASLWDFLPEEMSRTPFTPRRILACWFPQKTVLAHPSTGIFLSHCGWNSMLEAILVGIPVLAFPLFGDQHTNAACMANAGAAHIVPDTHEFGRFVEADEIVERLKTLTEDVGVKEKCDELKALGLKACEESEASLRGIMNSVSSQWVIGLDD